MYELNIYLTIYLTYLNIKKKMNIEQQKEHFKKFIQEQNDLFFKKGNDYATEDRLSNFKLSGAIIGTTAEKQCLGLIATKVARLGSLLSGKIPMNESLHDTCIDLANYAILLDQILNEQLISEK